MPETRNPEQVLIFDTTLRDGVQSPGISLNTEQSVDIAQRLNALGVDIIEAGFPVSSPGNFEAVETISRQVEGPIIAGLARVYPEDIDSAARALKDAERPRIHTFISTSDIHIEHQMRSTREEVKALARAGVAYARGYVEDVEFSPMDATRSDPAFTAEVIQIAIDEGATTINIPDTVGYTQPEEFKRFLGKLYDLVPALGGVVLSVHCHDDLGLAVANSFAGIQAGARQVEVAVNGIGERAGNAALEEVVMLLRTRREIDGFDTGIVTEEIGPVSRMVSRYTNYSVAKNKAVVGTNAFRHESGIHQAGVLNDRSTFEIMEAGQVGMDVDSIVLGRQSGRKAVRHILEKEGAFKGAYLDATFKLFKELADQVGSISTEQIVEIHEEARRRETSLYRLDELSLSGDLGDYTAKVSLTERSTKEKIKASANHNGLDLLTADSSPRGINLDFDGSVSAIFAAIKQGTDTDHNLSGFHVDSVGEGEKTIGKATVVLDVNGEPVTGQGISLDVLRASAWAYLDAIQKASEIIGKS